MTTRQSRSLVLLLAVLLVSLASAFQPRAPVRVRMVSPARQSSFTHLTAESTMSGMNGESTADEKPSFAKILWRFTRPHTIIGSAMAIPSIHLLAAPSLAAAFSTQNLVAILYAMVPALLMNLYVTGLNQITDVEIDKINKPDLPLAAGFLSMPQAQSIVAAAGALSLGLGWAVGTQGLNVALWGSAILGTLYSVEPFRLKRYPFLAAFCIVAVRGAVINAGFFAHANAAAFGGPLTSVLDCLRSDPRCALSSLFFTVFGVVIALMKDVPDVVGDRTLNIRTFSVRLGQKRVFGAMRNLLSGLFGACGVWFVGRAGVTTPVGVARLVTGVAAGLFGWSVYRESVGVDPTDPAQVYGYYMHLWKLFYLSYVVLPFAM